MSNCTASLIPSHIHRQANDYDVQIQQGLEDRNVQQVVKQLRKDLVSRIFFILLIFTDIGLEQKAAFLKPLFLYVFICGWNKKKNNPNFLNAQLAILKKFDKDQQSLPSLPASTLMLIPTVPAPKAPSRPKAKFATPSPAARVITQALSPS
jgi:hypothetical protein